MREKRRKLHGDLEILIMKEVWKQGRATVHDVRDALRNQRKLAYTTVLTTMRNLEKKGFLVHETDGRSYVYLPLVDRETVARFTARDLLERFFDGSRAQFVNALFNDEQLSTEQFERLRREILDLRQREEENE
ncbi:MAG: BlaI/MecI/CopY family transcriptional regulator [bacterium]